jgi:hypothetical protein
LLQALISFFTIIMKSKSEKHLSAQLSTKNKPFQSGGREYMSSTWASNRSSTAIQYAQSQDQNLNSFDYVLSQIESNYDPEKSSRYLPVDTIHTSSNTSDDFPARLPPATLAPQASTSMSRKRTVAFIFITCIAQFLSLSALNQTVAPMMVCHRGNFDRCYDFC